MYIPKQIEYKGHVIHLADASDSPTCREFVEYSSAKRALAMSRIAWGVEVRDKDWLLGGQSGDSVFPLNFRLEGKPGVGKNEIVYQLAHKLDLPYFSIVGHEEMAAEDLILAVVPEESPAGKAKSHDRISLVLRASPLATAFLAGGIFFFDEMNRAPARALSPLAALLDDRRKLFSAITEMWLEREPYLIEAESRNNFQPKPFLFCAALNNEIGVELPEYIKQRTLPRISVEGPDLKELAKIVRLNLGLSQKDRLIRQFMSWGRKHSERTVSVRQALTLFRVAMRIRSARSLGDETVTNDNAFQLALQTIFPDVTEPKPA